MNLPRQSGINRVPDELVLRRFGLPLVFRVLVGLLLGKALFLLLAYALLHCSLPLAVSLLLKRQTANVGGLA